MHQHHHFPITTGTIGGTLLSIFGSITFTDILKTALLAAVGALVSFGISYGCKLLLERFRK